MILAFKEFFKCPPQMYLSKLLTILFCFGFLYLCLYCFDSKSATPGNCSYYESNSSIKSNASINIHCDGGNSFGLFVLFISAVVGGKLFLFMKLPPLLGMLIFGFMLRNIRYINAVIYIHSNWNSCLRKMALLVILVRAGFGLDGKALKKLSFVVFRLASIPCLIESFVVAVVAHFLLNFPWGWSFILGFVLSAVSPAVIVPSILELEKNGLGIDKGLNTLIIAASSIDDVLAITGFGVALAITFTTTDNIVLNIFSGPLEVMTGVLYGILIGCLLWFLPSTDNGKFMFYRIVALFLSAVAAMFGSTTFHLPGSGPLAVLILSFVASIRWKKDAMWKSNGYPIIKINEIFWWLLQPFLFGLIGAGLDVTSLTAMSFGYGILTLVIGLVFRLTASYVILFRTEFNIKERFFIAIAWLPKATIQAAIGPLALDLAIKQGSSAQFIEYGQLVLAVAVISIILTAPIGALLISLTAPLLLKRSSQIVNPENGIIELKDLTPETDKLYQDQNHD